MKNLVLKSRFKLLWIALLPGLIFFLIQQAPSSLVINKIINQGSENLFLVLIPLLIFALVYRRAGWTKYLVVTGFLALFFGLYLKWFWTYGFSNTTHLWGYLPTSDTGSYFRKAVEMLLQNPIESTAANRPLFTIFLSSLLWVSNLNPMVALWIMGYLNIFGCLVASNEVNKTHGSWAAAIFLVCDLLFFRYFIGTFMTEQLGLLLGNVAFAFMWKGVHARSLKLTLAGLFILSLALNIRAGAMFVLITIPLGLGYIFKEKKYSLKIAGLALAIGISGFLLNSFAYQLFVTKDIPMFSNFGYTLYGVAVGNQGWDQIFSDHPGITAAEAMPVAIRQILSDPGLFIKGVAQTYVDFFNPGACWAFCFLRFTSLSKNLIVFVFFVCGLFFLFRNWKKPLSLFLFSVGAGIFLSIPFAPTIDVGYRSYTVTNPFLTSVLFLSFPWIKSIFTKKWPEAAPRQAERDDPLFSDYIFKINYAVLGLTGILMCVLPLVFFFGVKVYPPAEPITCEEDEIALEIWTNSAAWIQVVPDEEIKEGLNIPYATPGRLAAIVERAKYHYERGYAETLKYIVPGSAIGVINNNLFKPDASMETPFDSVLNTPLVVVNASALPKKSGIVSVCVRQVQTDEANKVKVFVASNIQTSNSQGLSYAPNRNIENSAVILLDILIAAALVDSLLNFLFPYQKK